ncbi:MAG: hypothetical protein QM722_01555 [Piscinibacter sp.]
MGGFVVAYWLFSSPAVPAELAERIPALYQFLLNKWYFDELYDLMFVRPAQVARPLPVEGAATTASSTARAGRHLGAVSTSPRGVVAASDRLYLSLCLRDADRGRRADQMVPARRGVPLMIELAILSVVRFLPLVGALLILSSAATTKRSRATSRCGRAVDDDGHLRAVACLEKFDRPSPTSSSSRRKPGLATHITY